MGRKIERINDRIVVFFCPACDRCHKIFTPEHFWNGDPERPTISPSIYVEERAGDGFSRPQPPRICHSQIRDGAIRYLPDSSHRMKGQIVDMVEV